MKQQKIPPPGGIFSLAATLKHSSTNNFTTKPLAPVTLITAGSLPPSTFCLPPSPLSPDAFHLSPSTFHLCLPPPNRRPSSFHLSPLPTSSPALTTPLPIQIYYRHHHQLVTLGSKNDAHPLAVVGYAFQWIRTALVALFDFLFIQHPFLPYFLHFPFIDVPAVHSAQGMFAIHEFCEGSVQALRCLCAGGSGKASFTAAGMLVAFHPVQQQDRRNQIDKIEILFIHRRQR